MKLYELLFRHYSPKDSREGIVGYLVTETDELVYDFIQSEPTLKNGKSLYVGWVDKEDPENEDMYDEDFRDRIIFCCGEMFDDEAEVSDLYYGLTHYGWNCINQDVSLEQIATLEKIGIKVDIFNIK